MLQKIHERVQGVIAWVLIILIAVTFTLWGINYYLESHSASDVQAEVNGEKISKTDFSGSYERLKRQAESQAGELSPLKEKMLKQRAMKQLIFTRVVLQGAHEAGYFVTREQAEQALMQIPQFQEDGQFSPEKFQQALSSALYTPSVFLNKIQEGLILNQQRFSFAATAFVLPEELNNYVGLAKQTRDLSYFVIPEKSFESDVDVSQEELKSYYKKNTSLFKMPEKVSIEYVSVSINKVLANTYVSDKAAKHYYEDNIDAYTHPAQWQWAHILVRVSPEAGKKAVKKAYQKALNIEKLLQRGQSFAVIAKKNSDDVLSSAKGGLTPWISELALNPDVLEVLKKLKNKEISSPLKTQYGYEIIQRVGYQPSKQIPFSEVKQQIIKALKTDKAQQTFAQIGDDLTNLSYQNPSSLDEVAKELELSIHTTAFFTRQGLPKGIASNKEIIRAAFSDEVLHEGNNSQLISINDDLLIVLRVKKHTPQSFIPFEQVKMVIKKQLIKKKASNKASEYGKSLLASIEKNDAQSNNKLKKVIAESQQKYHWNWHSQNNVSRDDTSLNMIILQTLFKMPHPSDAKAVFQGVKMDNGDYAILKLNQLHEGTADSLDHEELKLFKDEIEAAFGIVDYNLYVEGLMHQAEIVEHSK